MKPLLSDNRWRDNKLLFKNVVLKISIDQASHMPKYFLLVYKLRSIIKDMEYKKQLDKKGNQGENWLINIYDFILSMRQGWPKQLFIYIKTPGFAPKNRNLTNTAMFTLKHSVFLCCKIGILTLEKFFWQILLVLLSPTQKKKNSLHNGIIYLKTFICVILKKNICLCYCLPASPLTKVKLTI